MKERPIIFSAPMVRAILEGRKTQTRRVLKHSTEYKGPYNDAYVEQYKNAKGWERICPYGVPGDRLWIRENGWERPYRTEKMLREGADTWRRYYYDADGLSDQDRADFKAWGFARRPSIHMPRWASRITLEIESVRVQRLQDISEADAYDEGIEATPYCEEAERMEPATGVMPGRYAFRALWESICGPDSWAANPWVWAITFRRIEDAAATAAKHTAAIQTGTM